MFIKRDIQDVSQCQNVDAADMSRSLKMVELWQPWRSQHDTVEGWMLPVNVYLHCECVSVCGTAWRQELLWGFICGMTRQPVIYEHLELLFKHSLISRQTFPEARAEQELLGPDKTSHRLSASHPTREPSVGCASWEQPIKARVRVFTTRVLWAQLRQLRATVWLYSDGDHLLRVFSPSLLIELAVNGAALNINGRPPSSLAGLNIFVEMRTKRPSLMFLFRRIYLKVNTQGHYRGFEWAACACYHLLDYWLFIHQS